MKIAAIVVRTLLGLMFLFASVSYFLHLFPIPPTAGQVKVFNDGLMASGYIMPLVKSLELLCGLFFLIGRYNTLATVIIFPIIINILLFHAMLAPQGVPMAAALLAGDLFLAYYHRNNYASLFAAK